METYYCTKCDKTHKEGSKPFKKHTEHKGEAPEKSKKAPKGHVKLSTLGPSDDFSYKGKLYRVRFPDPVSYTVMLLTSKKVKATQKTEKEILYGISIENMPADTVVKV